MGEQLNKLVWLIAAALSGSVVGITIHPDTRTPIQRLLFLFSGMATAFWLAQPIATYFNLTDPGQVAACGFAIGVFWASVLEKLRTVIDAIKLPFNRGGAGGDETK